MLYHLKQKPIAEAFYKLSNKATKMLIFIDFEKTPNFGCMVRTLDYARKLKLEFSDTLILLWMKIDKSKLIGCFTLKMVAK